MALDLVSTAAASNANTYCDLDDANQYHEERLHAEIWTAAAVETRKAALVWAARLLDMHADWEGVPWTSGQALRWPRAGVYDPDGRALAHDAIPTFLKHAAAELARHLISEDRTAEPDTLGFKTMKVDTISLTVDKYFQRRTLPASVRAMIAPYVSGAGGRRLVRG